MKKNLQHIVLLGACLSLGACAARVQNDNRHMATGTNGPTEVAGALTGKPGESTEDGLNDSRRMAAEMNGWAEEASELARKEVVGGDSADMYRAVIEGVRYSFRCDELDRVPDASGKVRPQFAAENEQRIRLLYPLLIDAGLYFVKDERTRRDGLGAMELYLAWRKSEMVAGLTDESGLAAYHLAYYSLKANNLRAADSYADLALKYDETALGAAEIKAQCMNREMVTAEDSMRYLAVIGKLYETDPTNEIYFSWIMRFYQHPTPRFNIEDFVDRQLEENSGSVIPWILKGEIAMHAGRWDEAVEAYKQADEIDPSIVPVIYNIGVSLNRKGIEVRKSVAARRRKRQKASDKEFVKLFAEARIYLERVREKDPHRDKVDWVGPLYLDYMILNEKTKAAELEPLVNRFKK